MDLQLRDRVVCITGGSRGIGRATALSLLREGARVEVCGRDEAALQDVVAEAGAFADQLLAMRADVHDDYEESASSLSFEQWTHQEASRRDVPLGRMGDIEEVVPWIFMLVSPLASFVTGTEINVSGGLGTRV